MPDSTCDLAQKKCLPCEGGSAKYTAAEIQEKRKLLDDGWTLEDGGQVLSRQLKFKGFAKTMYFVNALAYLADQEGHHPDVCFGWGYCTVRFSTHAIGGLSENDFICAAKVDRLIAS